MAEIVSAPSYETTKQTTKSGAEYSIGRPQGSAGAADSGQPDSHGGPFVTPVNWPTSNTSWTDTDPAFHAQTGISRYKFEIGGIIYHYRLWFTTDQTYDYTFNDAAGQGYECNVWITSEDHYIDYNSNNANIVQVSGE